MPTNHKSIVVVSWALQAIVALILAQTLYFKFTGAPESVHIFRTLGVEPWGRLLAGAMELVAALALLIPRTAVYGAMLAFGVIVGAIGAHLTRLGIVVEGDGGLLFGLAVAVLLGSAAILWIRRGALPILGRRLVPHACPFRPGERPTEPCNA